MTQVSIVGDFGGTNARLALSTAGGISNIQEYRCADFKDPAHIVQAYLQSNGFEKAERAVIGVAGASEDPSRVVFVNGPWSMQPLDFTAMPAGQVEAIHDFAAVCYSIATISEADCTPLIQTQAAPFFPGSILTGNTFKGASSRVLTARPEHRFISLGPGTGLGVGTGVVTESRQFLVVNGEGGHLAFAPRDAEELQIKEYLEQDRGMMVSHETIACGTGLAITFNAVCKVRGIDCSIQNGAELTAKMDDSRAEVRAAAGKTLNMFATTLGECAAAATLINNARTVFIGGGVLKKLGSHFDKAAFAHAFTNNDLKQNNTLLDTPVMVIDHPQAGLAGADFYLKLTAA
jgi:glucokinase